MLGQFLLEPSNLTNEDGFECLSVLQAAFAVDSDRVFRVKRKHTLIR
jgi:hypothetical protein